MSKTTVRVAAIQVELARRSYGDAIENARGLLCRAAKLGAQIACMPEHWLLEHREQGYAATKELAEVAKSENICIITGANYTPVNEGGRTSVYIRSALIDAGGETIGDQDKVHLFREEKKVAQPGKRYEVFETRLGKVGIIICYDNVFPESCRTLALKGADIVFVPSRIVADGLDPWLVYLKARALENRIPIVAPNVFYPPKFPGGSVIIDPREENSDGIVTPKLVGTAGEGEAVVTADINLDASRALRKNRLADRQPNAYSGIEV